MCGILTFKGKSKKHPDLVRELGTIAHRGPDSTEVYTPAADVFLGFVRLAIMDPTPSGNQPFVDAKSGFSVICNGEIYNSDALRMEVDFPFRSGSDCEVLLPLLQNRGLADVCQSLDAEFAFVAYDPKTKKMLAARDPIGIRPLFVGYTKSKGEIAFASEAKALSDWCEEVSPFPPGHYYDGEKFLRFADATDFSTPLITSEESALTGIAAHLTKAVHKRLTSDEPIGFLLSGGLDSSLVCAIAAKKLSRPIRTFSIGCTIDAIDNAFAERVADYIGADHTTVHFTLEEAAAALPNVIYHLETFDITTIRAAIGMYLVCQYIQQNTDIKVVLTGEVSDEIFGYKYTDFAPSPAAFQDEAKRRVRELFMYDVLRADRSITAHSLEARVPFSDKYFVEHVMSIAPELKMNRHGIGKYLLRQAFADSGLLPDDILYREKAAFSDAVGHSVADSLKELAEELYSPAVVQQKSCGYLHAAPYTAESLMYREIFERFFPLRAEMVSGFWLPNQSWQGCQVADPSARALSNYGGSGDIIIETPPDLASCKTGT